MGAKGLASPQPMRPSLVVILMTTLLLAAMTPIGVRKDSVRAMFMV